jgi:hypothetical protein
VTPIRCRLPRSQSGTLSAVADVRVQTSWCARAATPVCYLNRTRGYGGVKPGRFRLDRTGRRFHSIFFTAWTSTDAGGQNSVTTLSSRLPGATRVVGCRRDGEARGNATACGSRRPPHTDLIRASQVVGQPFSALFTAVRISSTEICPSWFASPTLHTPTSVFSRAMFTIVRISSTVT